MNFKIYQQLKKLYDSNDFEKLLKDSDSLLFLKIRSIARKALLIEFANQIRIDSNQNTNALIEKITNHPKTDKKIDKFIKSEFQVERNERRKYQDNSFLSFTNYEFLIGVDFIKTILNELLLITTSRKLKTLIL